MLEPFRGPSCLNLDAAISIVNAAGPALAFSWTRCISIAPVARSIRSRERPHLRLPFAHVADAPVQKSYATEELLHAGPAERLPPVEGEIDIRRVPEHMPDGIPVAHRSAHDCDGGDRKFSSRRASRTMGGIAAVGD